MKKILLSFSFSIVFITILAGQKTVTGVVVDEIGVPLPGASVVEVGTTNGVSTDFDGNYTIDVGQNSSLEFSFVGYGSIIIQVGEQDKIDVTLNPSNELAEVVVVGYGSQKKVTLTDNVARVTSEDLSDVPTPNLFNAITGRVAGVQINQTNGKVEAGLNFRIRGQSSISAGSDPLYVLDGVPLINDDESSNGAPTNPLITLNPSEIESIDILKDASAASIYGSRGANGVVIITTKKGRSGEASFNINFSNGFSSPAKTRDWMNADEYIEIFTEAAENGLAYGGWPGNGAAYVESRFDRYSDYTWQEGAYDTDWEKIALVDGHTRDADISMSGGSEKTNYYFSVSYNDTKGIVRGNELKKINARTNVSHNFSDKFSLSMNLGFNRSKIDRIANDNAFVTPLQAIAQAPISPAFLDGEPFSNTVYPNFLLEDKYGFFTTIIRRATGKISGDYQIIPNLKFTSSFAFDSFAQTEDQFRGSKTPFQSTNGEGTATNVQTENYIFSNYLTYDKNFGEDHILNAVLGTEYNESNRRFTSVQGEQFPTDDFQTLSSAAEITSGSGSTTAYSFLSYFSRVTYSFKNKYLLKLGLRYDGSSRFGKNAQYGTFPSFSAGWILSEEDFIADNGLINFLKFRASWGQVGNAEIGNFASRGLFGGVSYNQRPGIAPIQAENAQLSWESSAQTDISLQFGILENKISGEITYYNKDTDNLLFDQPLPLSSGASSITKNIGRLKNSGLEFLLDTKNIVKEDFNWKTSFNVGINTSEVVTLPGGNDVINSRNILREGEPLYSFYLPEYAGVDSQNGDALYYLNTDENGTLNKSTTNEYTDAKRIVAGNPLPEFIFGLTNTLNYKNFDFTLIFQGEFGASIYNSAGRFQSANGDWFDNQTKDQLNRWQNPGDETDVPQARLGWSNGTGHSTRYLEDGDFIRLRNLTVGYNFSEKINERLKLKNGRVYLSGFNLLTFTNYSGYDPESRTDAGGIGQVFYSAPAARTLSIGLNLGF